MSAIKHERTPGMFERIGSALVPIMATALVLIAVTVGAVSVVFMAIGIESVKAIAASVLCVVSLMPVTVVGALYIVQQRQHVAALMELVRPEPVRVVAPEPRQLQPPTFNTPDRFAEVGAGHWVDTTSPRALAQVAYEKLMERGVQPSCDNIKYVLGLTDNGAVTSVQQALRDMGLAHKTGDNRTASWRWVNSPAPAG